MDATFCEHHLDLDKKVWNIIIIKMKGNGATTIKYYARDEQSNA